MDSSLEKLKQALEAAVEGMTTGQLTLHSAGQWSAAEILEHLYLTYAGTIKGFERVISAGKPLATKATMKHRVRNLVVTGLGHMPSGRQAPEMTRPRGMAAGTIRNDIGEKILAMDAIITACEGRFGRGAKLLDHPILGPLSATQWRKFHVVHGMHHQKQLLRLREGTKPTN
jgi:hypothetical protein